MCVCVCVVSTYMYSYTTSLALSPAILCFGFFIVSIPFILGNGVYLFSLFDQFAAGVLGVCAKVEEGLSLQLQT